jgi:hypothetical protein
VSYDNTVADNPAPAANTEVVAPTAQDVHAAASLIGKLGAYTKWANCPDRTRATEPARRGLEQKFLTEADGDPLRAVALRKAHYARMALKSVQARRVRKAGAS